jgi:CRISPR-associated protein Cmr4
MSTSRKLILFTRTPLHVGAGASVGAIDQPIQRERHTGFPIIPASSLKGTFADHWNDTLIVTDAEKPERPRGRVSRTSTFTDAAWLFGSDDANQAAAGALLFGEARLLAFPIRSAKGSFAWITCPLLLQRAVRDGILPKERIEKLAEPTDDTAIFDSGNTSKLALKEQVVLEEYTFKAASPSSPWLGLTKLSEALAALIDGDPVWAEVKDRLIILSNGMMSYFVRNACEIAQHVRIDDATGTASPGGLFNQENVPSETLFYAVIHGVQSRIQSAPFKGRSAVDALDEFSRKVATVQVFQFGADASTGLGYCSVNLAS